MPVDGVSERVTRKQVSANPNKNKNNTPLTENTCKSLQHLHCSECVISHKIKCSCDPFYMHRSVFIRQTRWSTSLLDKMCFTQHITCFQKRNIFHTLRCQKMIHLSSCLLICHRQLSSFHWNLNMQHSAACGMRREWHILCQRWAGAICVERWHRAVWIDTAN